MIDDVILESLRKRYCKLHPLIFQRSVEKAENSSNLFDILESIPKSYPFFWDDTKKKWIKTKDFCCLKKTKQIL
jgi:hypothetical protein